MMRPAALITMASTACILGACAEDASPATFEEAAVIAPMRDSTRPVVTLVRSEPRTAALPARRTRVQIDQDDIDDIVRCDRIGGGDLARRPVADHRSRAMLAIAESHAVVRACRFLLRSADGRPAGVFNQLDR